MKVLIIEDSPEIIYNIEITFKLRWPGAVVNAAENGADGVEKTKTWQPNVVILDINLPDINGFEVLKKIREFSDVPVVILTVRCEEADELRGLEYGADDYITKPFSPGTLLSRLHAVLRRCQPIGPLESYEIRVGNVVINPSKMVVLVNGNRVHLTRNESRILFCLAEHAGQVVMLEKIKKNVWGGEADTIDNGSLKRYIFQLRNKLGDNGNDPRLILNEHGIGYRLADSSHVSSVKTN